MCTHHAVCLHANHESLAGEFVTNDYPGVDTYVKDQWGGYKQLQMSILTDFFKHAYDGSGDDGKQQQAIMIA